LEWDTGPMRGFGWQYPFVDRGWAAVRSVLATVEWGSEDDYPPPFRSPTRFLRTALTMPSP